ncbi:MAG: exo-alpha-sialidase [Flavobacteriaceae bacterium]
MTYFKKFLFVLLTVLVSCQEKKVELPQIDLNLNPDELALFGKDLISTHLYERDMAISPDGDEITYTLGNYKQSFRCLVQLKKTDEGWGERQILSFSGKYHDIEPFYSPDGQKLYFASTRPMDADTTRTDYNLWVVKRTNSGWAEPAPLDTLINTTKDEFYPSVSKNGNLYYTATREDGIGREDIFLSKFTNGAYLAPIPLDSTVNTAVFEFNAYVSPDEDLLVFSAFGRKDGQGGGDLYYSKKDAEGNWTAAKNLGEIVNSDKLDFCPYVDLERGNFYFTSDRAAPLNKKINKFSELEEDATQR